MSVLLVVTGAGVLLLLAYRLYGAFLARRVFELDDRRRTPAVALQDGVDFVPASKGMLLGQHFSAIAAAGPINGPILAGVLFGWAPALIWILLGSILIGGVHDMGSLVASLRNQARSITEVIRQSVSRRAWVLFMLFIWVTLIYIIVAFTDITASSFVGTVALESGERVGGAAVASSSLMYLALPVVMGLLMRFAGLRERWALCIFLPLVGVAIWAGKYLPIGLGIDDPVAAQKAWGALILLYCLVASVLPMWLLLQPRGALGGYFLYAALLAAAVGVVFGGYRIQYPAFTRLGPDGGPGGGFWLPMFPLLFITIACGACSGFHALVSSGTTCKQVARESDARPIAYGAMLLEAMVGVVALACVMILAKDDPLVSRAPNFIYASGIGRFLELLGIPAGFGVSFGLMAFTTFVYDTLDVCTRLGRYIIEELTGLRNLAGKALGSLLTTLVPIAFIYQTMRDARGVPIPAWRAFWNTFGASNQLLAALALIGVTVWLLDGGKRRYWLVAFLPAAWMFGMSNWALVGAVLDGWVRRVPTAHPAVAPVSLLLIVLSVLVAVETGVAMLRRAPARQGAAGPGVEGA